MGSVPACAPCVFSTTGSCNDYAIEVAGFHCLRNQLDCERGQQLVRQRGLWQVRQRGAAAGWATGTAVGLATGLAAGSAAGTAADTGSDLKQCREPMWFPHVGQEKLCTDNAEPNENNAALGGRNDTASARSATNAGVMPSGYGTAWRPVNGSCHGVAVGRRGGRGAAAGLVVG